MYINHYWHFRFKYRVNSVIGCVCAWFVVCFFVIKRVELRPFRYGYCIVATYCVQLFTIILHITTAQLFLVDILSWIIYMENERKRAKKGEMERELEQSTHTNINLLDRSLLTICSNCCCQYHTKSVANVLTCLIFDTSTSIDLNGRGGILLCLIIWTFVHCIQVH